MREICLPNAWFISKYRRDYISIIFYILLFTLNIGILWREREREREGERERELCSSCNAFFSITATSRVVICTGGRILLRCEPGNISIVQVLYGRTDASICSLSSSAPTSTDCELSTADAKVRSECEGETSCYVLASNSFFLGDPCPGISKYLSVEYQCV